MGPPLRMGFDQSTDHATQASSGYAQPYHPPASQHQPSHYQPPAYHNYHHTPSHAYPTSSQATNYPYSHRGRGGREAYSGGTRGRSHHNDRGDKFRHKGQRNGDFNSAQKSDLPSGNSSGKKKKRKTNTLGLTPGGEDSSEEEEVDEEARLKELLGDDLPGWATIYPLLKMIIPLTCALVLAT